MPTGSPEPDDRTTPEATIHHPQSVPKPAAHYTDIHAALRSLRPVLAWQCHSLTITAGVGWVTIGHDGHTFWRGRGELPGLAAGLRTFLRELRETALAPGLSIHYDNAVIITHDGSQHTCPLTVDSNDTLQDLAQWLELLDGRAPAELRYYGAVFAGSASGVLTLHYGFDGTTLGMKQATIAIDDTDTLLSQILGLLAMPGDGTLGERGAVWLESRHGRCNLCCGDVRFDLSRSELAHIAATIVAQRMSR